MPDSEKLEIENPGSYIDSYLEFYINKKKQLKVDNFKDVLKISFANAINTKRRRLLFEENKTYNII